MENVRAKLEKICAEYKEELEDLYSYSIVASYLEDVLDIGYKATAWGTYVGAEVCLAYGGYTAVLDTESNLLEVSQGNTEVFAIIDNDVTSMIDDYCAEMFGFSRA